MTEPTVDVVVRAHDGLLDQIQSLGHNRTRFEIVVVGRCELPPRHAITAIEREWPAGRSDALALHPDRDVVLIAPGVRPFGNWLDRLRDAVESEPDMGRVAPLVNGGPSSDYPLAGSGQALRLELSGAELDLLAARANGGVRVPVDITPEDCVYLRRSKPGERHAIAADIVMERGDPAPRPPSQPEPNAPAHAPPQLQFSAPGPLSTARLALDLARLDRALSGMTRFLFVTHNWGGGTERHTQHLRGALARDGVAVIIGRPDLRDRHVLRFESPLFTPNLPQVRLEDPAQFSEVMRQLRIDRVHLHSLAGFHKSAARFFTDAIDGPYDVTVHDGQPVCPRITLIGITDVYCGEPAEQSCHRCIDHLGSPFGEVVIEQWRRDQAGLLSGAASVIAPSRDLAARIERHLPGVRVRTEPHPEPGQAGDFRRTRHSESLRIGVLGKIGPPKGADLLQRVAAVCERDHPDMEIRVLGSFDDRLQIPPMANVHVTGEYDDDRLLGLMGEHDLDLVWFPAIVPESYSYTLSVALRTPLPIVAFDFGAIAERLRDARRGVLLDPKLMFRPASVAEALRRACDNEPEPPVEQPTPPRSLLRDYYRL